MLIESGDLIPVLPESVDIPWTRRKTLILNCLHRGKVNFQTFVYDTNVGDIAPLSTYFNPERWTEHDLNFKFGTTCSESDLNVGSSNLILNNTAPLTSVSNVLESNPLLSSKVKSASIQPRLLLIPENDDPQENTPEICEEDEANQMTLQMKAKATRKQLQPSVGNRRSLTSSLPPLMDSHGFKSRGFKPYCIAQDEAGAALTFSGLDGLPENDDEHDEEANKKLLINYLKEFPMLSSSSARSNKDDDPSSAEGAKVRRCASTSDADSLFMNRFEPLSSRAQMVAPSGGNPSSYGRVSIGGKVQNKATEAFTAFEGQRPEDLLLSWGPPPPLGNYQGIQQPDSSAKGDSKAKVKAKKGHDLSKIDDKTGGDHDDVLLADLGKNRSSEGTTDIHGHQHPQSSLFLTFRPWDLAAGAGNTKQRSTSSPDFLEWREKNNHDEDKEVEKSLSPSSSPNPIGPPHRESGLSPSGTQPDGLEDKQSHVAFPAASLDVSSSRKKCGSESGGSGYAGNGSAVSGRAAMAPDREDRDTYSKISLLMKITSPGEIAKDEEVLSKPFLWARSSKMLPATPPLLDLGAPFSSVFDPVVASGTPATDGSGRDSSKKLATPSSSLMVRRGLLCPSLESTRAIWGSTASSLGSLSASSAMATSSLDLRPPQFFSSSSTWTLSATAASSPQNHASQTQLQPLSAPVPGTKSWTKGKEGHNSDESLFQFPSAFQKEGYNSLFDDDHKVHDSLVDHNQVLVSSIRKIVQNAPEALVSGSSDHLNRLAHFQF